MSLEPTSKFISNEFEVMSPAESEVSKTLARIKEFLDRMILSLSLSELFSADELIGVEANSEI